VRRLVAVVVAASALAAGCGASKEDEQQVKATTKKAYAALSDRNAGRFCRLLTTKLRTTVSQRAAVQRGQSCTRVLGFVLNFGGRGVRFAKDPEVGDVKIDGDSATVTVKQAGRKDGVGLAKESGVWRISAFDFKKL
jgi:hypothetical protein